MGQGSEPVQAPDADALDSYSETVMRVAATVTPHVAALEMSASRRNGRIRVGAGSAVLFTEDGYLLTNSHVVAGTNRGQFSATAAGWIWSWWAPTPCPISPWSMAGRRGFRLPRSGTQSPCGLASW